MLVLERGTVETLLASGPHAGLEVKLPKVIGGDGASGRGGVREGGRVSVLCEYKLKLNTRKHSCHSVNSSIKATSMQW